MALTDPQGKHGLSLSSISAREVPLGASLRSSGILVPTGMSVALPDPQSRLTNVPGLMEARAVAIEDATNELIPILGPLLDPP